MSRAKRTHVRRNRFRRQSNRGKVMKWAEHFGWLAKAAALDNIHRKMLALQADIQRARPGEQQR